MKKTVEVRMGLIENLPTVTGKVWRAKFTGRMAG